MHNIVNVLNAAELFTLKWLILCHLNGQCYAVLLVQFFKEAETKHQVRKRGEM